MSWLDPLLALKTQQAGTTAGTRQTINFASGATVTDDPANDRVNVTIAGGLPGVTVTGTPTAGQTVVASSASAASWGSVPRGNITNTSGATGDLITGDATTLTRLGIGSTGQVLTVSGGAPVWTSATNYFTYSEQTWGLNAGTVADGASITPTLVSGTSISWTVFTDATTSTDATGFKLATTSGYQQGGVAFDLTSVNRYMFTGRPWRLWVLWDTTTTNYDTTAYSCVGAGTDATLSASARVESWRVGKTEAGNANGTVKLEGSATSPVNNMPADLTNATILNCDVHIFGQSEGTVQAFVAASSAGAFPAFTAARQYAASNYTTSRLNSNAGTGTGRQPSGSNARVAMVLATAGTHRFLRTRLELAI